MGPWPAVDLRGIWKSEEDPRKHDHILLYEHPHCSRPEFTDIGKATRPAFIPWSYKLELSAQ